MVLKHLFYALFGFGARKHDFAAAALAFELKIHADAQHGKDLSAAGVLLFHFNPVAHTDVHAITPIMIQGILYYKL